MWTPQFNRRTKKTTTVGFLKWNQKTSSETTKPVTTATHIQNRTRPRALVQNQHTRELIRTRNTWHKYNSKCQARVTEGDSGLCCCTCVRYFERLLTPLCVARATRVRLHLDHCSAVWSWSPRTSEVQHADISQSLKFSTVLMLSLHSDYSSWGDPVWLMGCETVKLHNSLYNVEPQHCVQTNQKHWGSSGQKKTGTLHL